MFTKLFFLFFFSCLCNLNARDIRINEVMASNATAVMDEDGDASDWVEIFNADSIVVNLKGMGLTDDSNFPFKWVFPDTILHPGEFLIVWASGKNRSGGISSLHADFKISASGEVLSLTRSDGLLLDRLSSPALPTNVSYGRYPDGGSQFVFYHQPSPGTSNHDRFALKLLDAPSFSHFNGWYKQEFDLSLLQTNDSSLILYTLDGSVPDINNLNDSIPGFPVNYFFAGEWSESKNLLRKNRTYRYFEPIKVSSLKEKANDLSDIVTTYRGAVSRDNQILHSWWKKPQLIQQKTTTVRTRSYYNGNYSETRTASFLIDENGSGRYTLPVLSFVTDAANLFDYNSGIYVPGITYFDSGNSEHEYNVHAGNYFLSTEFPVHLELFETDGSLSLSQNLGLRIHGGGSRTHPMKGVRLYARNQYDEKSEMSYRFFPGETYPHAGVIDTYKRIMFRTGGNVMNVVHDAAASRILEPAKVEVQKSRPAVHFYNGEYWGLGNIRDRIDKYYFNSKYGIDPDNLIVLDAPWGVANASVVDEGRPEDVVLYNELFDLITVNDMQDPVLFDSVSKQLDLLSYIDYNLSFIYLNNIDWYGCKHFKYWRARETSPAPFHDGKWRFVVWDFDSSPMEADFDFLVNFIHPEGGGNEYVSGDSLRTAMLRSLLDNETFRRLFLNRFADHINTTFSPDRIKGIVNNMYEGVLPELDEHFKRWGHPAADRKSLEAWDAFAAKRPAYMRQQLIDHFSLGDAYNVQLDVSDVLHGHIQLNTIDINNSCPGVSDAVYPWSGKYFKGVPINLVAKPRNGYLFSHWSGVTNSLNDTITLEPKSNIELIAHFVPDTCMAYADEVLHFWLMDSRMPNNLPMDSMLSTYSCQDKGGVIYFHSALEGYPFNNTHPFWRKASMERRNSPSELNYQLVANNQLPYRASSMRGMQIRQPFQHQDGENYLEFVVCTKGYEAVRISMAIIDEGAADVIVAEYWDTENHSWSTVGMPISQRQLIPQYQLLEFDFTAVSYVDDNPASRFRIRFDGRHMSADEGNRVTLNNIAVKAKAIPSGILPAPEVVAVQHVSCFSHAAVKLAGLPIGGYTITVLPDSLEYFGESRVATFTVNLEPGRYSFMVTDRHGNSSYVSEDVFIQMMPVSPTGDSIQHFTDGLYTLRDIQLFGDNIYWFASEINALRGDNPLDMNTQLQAGRTYYAVNNYEGCLSVPFAVTIDMESGFNNSNYLVSAYPNPATSVIKVEFPVVVDEVVVSNLLGQPVILTTPGNSFFELNISDLPTGIYYLTVVSRETRETVKFIKK